MRKLAKHWLGYAAQDLSAAEQLRQINDSYIDNRYPVNELPASEQAPSLSKVREFVAIAREVFETAQSAIHLPRDEGGVP